MLMNPKTLKIFMFASYWLAIFLVSVPTIIVLFYNMSYTVFGILNTLGIVLATIHIVAGIAINIGIFAAKGEVSEKKKKFDNQTKILFVLIIIFQLFNLMFVQKV